MAGRGGELRSFAQDARDVVIASALVGLAAGLVVAGCDWLTVDVLLDWLRGLPLWLMAAGPCAGLLLAALSLRYLSNGASAGIADTWLQRFHDPDRDMNVREAPGGVLASIVYGVRARDPAMFALALGGVGAVALVAFFLPARRASRTNPAEVLRAG